MAGSLLTWIGGVVSTIAGSYVVSKVQNYQQGRKAHRDELKEKILLPLRAALEVHMRPFLTGQTPIIRIDQATTEYDPDAKVTEEPSRHGPVLVATFPSAAIFGPLPAALLQDVKTNHLPKLFAEFDGLYGDWTSYGGECHAWANKMAWWILEGSGMEAFPPKVPNGRCDLVPFWS